MQASKGYSNGRNKNVKWEMRKLQVGTSHSLLTFVIAVIKKKSMSIYTFIERSSLGTIGVYKALHDIFVCKLAVCTSACYRY